MCFAPLIMIGYLFTLHPNAAHTTNMNTNIVEVQTCETGLGAHARATGNGLYAGGLQYGLTWSFAPDWSLTFAPRAGVAYVDHDVRELPLRTPFELGAQFFFGFKSARFGVEYLHLSNAGLKDPNIGIDFVGAIGGMVF